MGPVDQFKAFRADIESTVREALDRSELGELIRAGERARPLLRHRRHRRGLPPAVRPGWALVGDADLVLDPITGQGISDALATPSCCPMH